MIKRAAVLGNPIKHSRSPVLHNAGYQALGLEFEYGRIQADADEVRRIVAEADDSYVGFSVTMPGKFAALDLATSSSPRARLIGSANTLVRKDDGWYADNTDADGVLGALSELCGGNPDALKDTAAVVIGAGGTSRPALWALARLGVSTVTVINRSDRRAELEPLADAVNLDATFTSFDADLAAVTREAAVVVSTVPSKAIEPYVPDLGHAPILDVIYEPWPTPLTIRAAANGYPSVGGHVMLAHQAYPQFEAFTGHKAPREAMWEALVASLA